MRGVIVIVCFTNVVVPDLRVVDKVCDESLEEDVWLRRELAVLLRTRM